MGRNDINRHWEVVDRETIEELTCVRQTHIWQEVATTWIGTGKGLAKVGAGEEPGHSGVSPKVGVLDREHAHIKRAV